MSEIWRIFSGLDFRPNAQSELHQHRNCDEHGNGYQESYGKLTDAHSDDLKNLYATIASPSWRRFNLSMYSPENLAKIAELAKNSSQPFYVFSLAQIEERCTALRESLPHDVDLFFSLKANSHPLIVATMKKMGILADVASAGELKVALEAGFTGSEIEFTGPGKTTVELALALQNDVQSIIVESLAELQSLDRLAKASGKSAQVHVRINPKSKVNASGRLIENESSQFGIDEEGGIDFMKASKSLANVQLCGLHLHSQSHILSLDHAVANYKFGVTAAKNFANKNETLLAIVNLGGGIGVPYASGQSPIEAREFGRVISEFIATVRCSKNLAKTRFRFELGRFLCAEAGAFVTRVLYRKTSRGTSYVITDGGFTQCQIATGSGQLVRRNLPLRVISNQSAKKDFVARNELVTIAGPSCYGMDIIATKINLPEIHLGDLICVENVGAYGYSFSPKDFLRQQPANEYFI